MSKVQQNPVSSLLGVASDEMVSAPGTRLHKQSMTWMAVTYPKCWEEKVLQHLKPTTKDREYCGTICWLSCAWIIEFLKAAMPTLGFCWPAALLLDGCLLCVFARSIKLQLAFPFLSPMICQQCTLSGKMRWVWAVCLMPLESHSLQHPGRGRSHGLEWLRGNKYFPGWGADVFAPLWLWMATILVRVFVDATCMMSPYGTAWRRQKEEAGAECGFHFQASA